MMQQSGSFDRGRQNRSPEKSASQPLSETQQEMDDLIGALEQRTPHLLEQLIKIAGQKKTPTVKDIQAVLNSLRVSHSQRKVGAILDGVLQYRELHPREKRDIPLAKAETGDRKSDQIVDKMRLQMAHLKKGGLPVSPFELGRLLLQADQSNPDLFAPKARYMGFKVLPRRERSEGSPGFVRYREALSVSGQPIESIVDHLLLSYSNGAFSPARSVAALFPVMQESEQFLQTLVSLEKVLLPACEMRIDRHGEVPDDILDCIAESAEYVAQLYTQNARHWRSQRHPVINQSTGPILLIEPGLATFPFAGNLSRKLELGVVLTNQWESMVYSELFKERGETARIYSQSLPSLPAASLKDKYQLIVINGDRLFENRTAMLAVQSLAHRLNAGGQLVLEYTPTAGRRFLAVQGEQWRMLSSLANLKGVSFEYRLGRTKRSELAPEGNAVFSPISPGEKDRIVFINDGNANQSGNAQNLTHLRKVLQSLAALQEAVVWDWTSAFLFSSSAGEGQRSIFSRIVSMVPLFGSSSEGTVTIRSSLLEKGRFEECIEDLVSNPPIESNPGMPTKELSLPELMKTCTALENATASFRREKKRKS